MRLAIVRQRYTSFGGAELFLERALAPLAATGVEIALYSRSWPESGAARATRVLVDPPYVGRLWRDWSFARAVCRRLAPAPGLLVQSHERIPCCDVFRAGDGVHAAWLEQRARSLGATGRARIALNPYHAYVRAMERRLFASPRLKAVICNSRMVRDEIASRFGVPGERLHVIYSAVDANRFSPEAARPFRAELRADIGARDDDVVFALVGSGYDRKGVRAAIEAIARTPGTRLVVVGRESRIRRYAAAAARSGAADRVRFVGPQRDPAPWLGAADAFLLPTRYDPLPNAALEAMACALPVITSTQCGAAELVSDWHCGLVCDALDVVELSRHVAALRDPALRSEMGRRAREGASTLTAERMVEALSTLYRRLLAPPESVAQR
jgi:UDP-glucose:(heptosyl)LPS alpha-1,3-glucosyltransferase